MMMMMMMKRESLLSRRRCASNPLQSRCESVRASYWPIGDRSSPSKPGIVDQVASFYFKLALGFQYLEGSLQIGLPLVFVPRPINCADCSLAFGFVPWLFSFFLSFFRLRTFFLRVRVLPFQKQRGPLNVWFVFGSVTTFLVTSVGHWNQSIFTELYLVFFCQKKTRERRRLEPAICPTLPSNFT